VEEVLFRHPQVMEAAVVARADPKWGESPCAFVTLKPDAQPTTAEDIVAYCRKTMATFKIPRTVVFGPLPKTSTGKIQKFVLRERGQGRVPKGSVPHEQDARQYYAGHVGPRHSGSGELHRAPDLHDEQAPRHRDFASEDGRTEADRAE
jgi:hypothetical protein